MGRGKEDWGTYGCTGLDVEAPYGISVVHCVEGGYFVYAHWRHFQYAGDFIHDTDAREAVLALAKIE